MIWKRYRRFHHGRRNCKCVVGIIAIRKRFERFLFLAHQCRDLSQNKLTDFDVEQDIPDLTNIRNLNLNKNRLIKFPILRGLELDTLKMEQNFIEFIPNEALLALPQLTVLHLNKNGIKSVLPNTFPSSSRLKIL